ncbi:hypothetical protein AWB80_01329 [Caballeronia pedi]|uniref:Uncharacterized protein n=1 Tax=Caballeronia pedi TaxID=1777141 RepID=A0A157ZUW5_9BURK|nr:hypothetical protein [Caballeronia pedi]SAK49301.1 hypothetical protein AWB80_01329 [Caballeronia pedi]
MTEVCVHGGAYLAHDLAAAMPRVGTGRYTPTPGEDLWERAARALLKVEPPGPYPHADVLTVFVCDDGRLTMRFDIEIKDGAARAVFVRDGVPFADHAPFPVDVDDDVVAVARKLFGAGLPQ